MRDSFIFYRSFYESMKLLETDEEKLHVFYTLCDFALDDKEIDESEFSKTELIILKIAIPLLTASRNNFEKGMKGKPYGVLGGRPKMDPNVKLKILEEVKEGISRTFICQKYSISDKTLQRILKENDNFEGSDNFQTSGQNPQNPNLNLNLNPNHNLNPNPNLNLNLNPNLNPNVNIKVVGDSCPEKLDKTDKTLLSENSSSDSTTTTDYFSIPSLTEVKDFVKKHKLNINPDYFWSYYNAKDWENVVNWRTTAIGWSKRERDPNASKPKVDSDDPYAVLGKA